MGTTEEFQTAKDALAALHANSASEEAAGIDCETDEYLRLNAAVHEAMGRLSPWQRLRLTF